MTEWSRQMLIATDVMVTCDRARLRLRLINERVEAGQGAVCAAPGVDYSSSH